MDVEGGGWGVCGDGGRVGIEGGVGSLVAWSIGRGGVGVPYAHEGHRHTMFENSDTPESMINKVRK